MAIPIHFCMSTSFVITYESNSPYCRAFISTAD